MSQQVVVVDAEKPDYSIDFAELYAYRDLFWIMASRDIKVRYAQTYLGVFWIFLQPLMQLIIFGFLFTKVARVAPAGIPFAVFAIPGLTAWTYFSTVALQSGQSLIGMQNTIRKVYFPRLILPLSKSLVILTDFFVYLAFTVLVMVIYQVPPSANLIFLPFFILLNMVLALGVGIWTSALTIRYRDFNTISQFVMQLGIYVTPVYYALENVPDKLKMIFSLNPAALVVMGFRWTILGDNFPIPDYAWYSLPVLIVIFITGILYFKRVEKVIADII